MTKEIFYDAIKLMVEALPAQQQEKRINALYQIYGELDFFVLKNAAKLVAQELEYFPAPSVFKQFIGRAGVVNKVDVPIGPCLYCDGNGWTMIDEMAHRGSCEHGARLPEYVKKAPDGWLDQKPKYKGKGERI
jgi:hypothetical protein